jgi:hypothetical protein
LRMDGPCHWMSFSVPPPPRLVGPGNAVGAAPAADGAAEAGAAAAER